MPRLETEGRQMFRRIIYMSFGVALLVLLAGSSIGAMNAKRTTYFTFSKSVELPGVTLPAGTYIFEAINPGSEVVTVLSRDRSKVHFLRITNRIERPRDRALKPTARRVSANTLAGTSGISNDRVR
jgi:hypothetical protein